MKDLRMLSALVAAALLAVLPPASRASAGAKAAEGGAGTIEVYGAVPQPGAQTLATQAGVSFADAIGRAGGYSADAFPLGIALLRLSRVSEDEVHLAQGARTCPSLPEQQVGLGINGYVPDARARAIKAEFASSNRYRVPLSLVQITNPDRHFPDVKLIDGDVLLIPPRPAHVYVQGEDAQVESLVYVPGWRAEDYTDSAGLGERAFSSADKMVLPNGEVRELALSFWAYRPTAVPPGTLLVMGAGEAGHCVFSSDR